MNRAINRDYAPLGPAATDAIVARLRRVLVTLGVKRDTRNGYVNHKVTDAVAVGPAMTPRGRGSFGVLGSTDHHP